MAPSFADMGQAAVRDMVSAARPWSARDEARTPQGDRGVAPSRTLTQIHKMKQGQKPSIGGWDGRLGGMHNSPDSDVGSVGSRPRRAGFDGIAQLLHYRSRFGR